VSAVIRPAHAKVNAFLRVLGRREDGYHDIQTLILPLELHDVVTAEPAERLEVVVRGERAGELDGAGGDSLVARAAHAWATAAGVGAPRARITVDKRIPVAAGLGGGSADAAAAILALDELNGSGLDRDALLRVAAGVGSDVPALLAGEPVFADGRGEHVVPVHAIATQWVVRPFAFGVAAADAYAWWDADPATGPDPGAVVAAFETGNGELLGSALFDDLQRGVVARHPEVARVIASFLEAGALGAVMTGSGPTVVALARHPTHADALCDAVPGSFATGCPPRTPPPRTMGRPSGVV
jgi:4-diphosphocytidyl-2-C-methyl-D-erythritol kinase